jgi:O-antigen/teichoic acid export membrane protein
VGIIGSIFYTAEMFTDLGFQAFLVRHERTDDRHFRDVIWTIRAKRGLALFALVALASPLIAWMFGKPVIALPLAVAAATFAFEGVASFSLITALRKDKARELSFLDLGLQVLQTATSILLALWWRSLWAMIGAMLLQSAMRTFLSYRLFGDSSQRLDRDKAIAREFLAFSKVVVVSSALTLLIAQSDKLVLARIFSLREFGLYALAINITNAPKAFCGSYITRVVFPVYAATWRERPAILSDVYYSVRRRASALFAFGCGGLMGAAPLVVAVLYDPRYAGASLFISLITVSAALQLPNLAAAELLTATGDIKGTLRVNVVRAIWLVIAIPLGYLAAGAIGVVAAFGAIEIPAMLYSWVLLKRHNVLRMREELLFLAIMALGAALGFAFAMEALQFLPHH